MGNSVSTPFIAVPSAGMAGGVGQAGSSLVSTVLNQHLLSASHDLQGR